MVVWLWDPRQETGDLTWSRLGQVLVHRVVFVIAGLGGGCHAGLAGVGHGELAGDCHAELEGDCDCHTASQHLSCLDRLPCRDQQQIRRLVKVGKVVKLVKFVKLVKAGQFAAIVQLRSGDYLAEAVAALDELSARAIASSDNMAAASSGLKSTTRVSGYMMIEDEHMENEVALAVCKQIEQILLAT